MVGFSVAEPGYPRLPSHILERVTDPSFFKAVSIIIFAPISNIITIVIAAKIKAATILLKKPPADKCNNDQPSDSRVFDNGWAT